MRMRKKPNLIPRMERCAEYLITDPEAWRGRWREKLSPNCALRLELGCGKGRFTCETAAAEPDVLFVAVERVPDAMVIAMERAKAAGLANVFFIDADVARLRDYFSPDEVERIYINFCDPWPRKKNAKRRLTYHTFLEKYKKVLKLGGQIHFKTDNANLFAWSLPEMESCFLELRNVTDDLHASGPVGIMTGYEEKFYALGTPIHRVEAVVVTKQPRPADAKEPEEAEAGEDA